MSQILVVHGAHEYPLRSAIADHLFSFRKYSGYDCFYVNAGITGSGTLLRLLRPDVIVFHTILLSARWNPPKMQEILRRLAPLRNSTAVKILLPQDEFYDSATVCQFIRDFSINHVFSVMPRKTWPVIYGELGDDMPAIHPVLTGYLDDETVGRLGELARTTARSRDIGYRAKHVAPFLGRHGQLKIEVARRVSAVADAHGLSTDISTRAEDTLIGENWLRFLASSRYTIGVEGGASILDRDGSLERQTRTYAKQHPGASFDEVEQACFPGRDGEAQLSAMSPRHLEAVAARTGQVLIEGEYGGLLRPMEHYLPLKRDFSNLDQVLELVKDEGLRVFMCDVAYRDIVTSGVCTYGSFVATVLDPARGVLGGRNRAPSRVALWILTASEWLSWRWLWVRTKFKRHIVVPFRALRATPDAARLGHDHL